MFYLCICIFSFEGRAYMKQNLGLNIIEEWALWIAKNDQKMGKMLAYILQIYIKLAY